MKSFHLSDGTLLIESPNQKEFLHLSQTLITTKPQKPDFDDNTQYNKVSEFLHLLGLIDLVFSRYLLVVKTRKLACTIAQHKVWKITAGEAILIGLKDEKTDHNTSIDQELLNSILAIINSGHLYYSTTYDLTHSLQHNANATPGYKPDDRYWFTKFIQTPLLQSTAAGDDNPWVLKAICGFASEIEFGNVGSQNFTTALVSRLSSSRLGTRYQRRGLDLDGNAANSCEMEQIIYNNDFQKTRTISSFVQMRGSAPLCWTQTLDLSYRPEMAISDINLPQVWKSIEKHLSDLNQQYHGGSKDGLVYCVNLLDDKGFEGELTDTYKVAVEKFDNGRVVYEGFPVNKWCKKMNFRNMDVLKDKRIMFMFFFILKKVFDGILNSGFFLAEGPVPSFTEKSSLKVINIQTGLLRVSCLDSLDRTNLTCTLFAKAIIPIQLDSVIQKEYKVSKEISSVLVSSYQESQNFTKITENINIKSLTNLWADSGDAISILYAGTRALKGDVTRTGQRQWIQGSIDDGVNSLTRYYLNNFEDGRKQDAYDLWSGKASTKQLQSVLLKQKQQTSTKSQEKVIEKGRGLGYFLPPFLIDLVEPVLRSTLEYSVPSKEEGTAEVVGGGFFLKEYLLESVRLYAPDQVTKAFEGVGKILVFLYVVVVVKVFEIEGERFVDVPRLMSFEGIVHDLD